MSHSAEKCKRGDPLGFINIYSVAKYQKTRKGDSFGTLKNFQKKSHSAEKNERGDPLVSSGFVGYVKKVKNKRGGPFALSLHRPDLACVVLSVSVKIRTYAMMSVV